MDLDVIAPMLVMITLILTTGGVILLRPISKHLAEYLRTVTEQKRAPGATADLAQLREVLSSMDGRLSLMEERQNFTEALLTSRREAPVLASRGRATADYEA